jgi:hypothetical protein
MFAPAAMRQQHRKQPVKIQKLNLIPAEPCSGTVPLPRLSGAGNENS